MPSGTEPPLMPGGSSTPEPLPNAIRRQLLNQPARIRIWLTLSGGSIVLVVLVLVVISRLFFVRSLPHPSRGNAWVRQQNVGTSHDLHGVVWSGTQFVAVGHSSAGSVILTSPDGRTWTNQQIDASDRFLPLSSVTWSGTQFVVVGAADTILTSVDGRTWTSQHTGIFGDLSSVVWSGTQFVAVGGTQFFSYSKRMNLILTSADGQTWTPQKTDTEGGLSSVAWSGTQFVAVGDQGAILTSADGQTWASHSTDPVDSLYGVTWSGTQFVAVGSNSAGSVILTSPDGRTWIHQKMDAPDRSLSLESVTWSGTQFVAVGAQFFVVGTQSAVAILTSPDGRTWIHQKTDATGPFLSLHSVTWSGTQFVAVGDQGTILTSP